MQNEVTVVDGQVRCIAGPKNTNVHRNNIILKGIAFEVKFPGFRLTAKAPKCSTLAKKEWGIKGTGAKLVAAAEAFAKANPEMFGYVNVVHSSTIRPVEG